MTRCNVCGRFIRSSPYPRKRRVPGSDLKIHLEVAHGWKKNNHRGTEYGIPL